MFDIDSSLKAVGQYLWKAPHTQRDSPFCLWDEISQPEYIERLVSAPLIPESSMNFLVVAACCADAES